METVEALNRAADEVLTAIDAGDTGIRDVVNLVVNVAAYFAEFPKATLDDAIRASYGGVEPNIVLGWALT